MVSFSVWFGPVKKKKSNHIFTPTKSSQIKSNQKPKTKSKCEHHGLVLRLLHGTSGALEPRPASREAADTRPEHGVSALEENRRVLQGAVVVVVVGGFFACARKLL